MIDLYVPEIFSEFELIAGITKRNINSYQPYGFSITPALIYDDDIINKHRIDLCKQINIESRKFKIQKQIHSDIIRFVDFNSKIEESDAMITHHKGLVLNVSVADCAGILIYCKDVEVIAGVHSGWKGTSLNIVEKTIDKLIEIYKAKPENMLVFVSPSASGENYEVEWDVAKFFPNSTTQISETKYLYDNKNEIKNQLINKGVKIENIEISKICTIADENYHSYRRDKNLSGRMSCFIGMKK